VLSAIGRLSAVTILPRDSFIMGETTRGSPAPELGKCDVFVGIVRPSCTQDDQSFRNFQSDLLQAIRFKIPCSLFVRYGDLEEISKFGLPEGSKLSLTPFFSVRELAPLILADLHNFSLADGKSESSDHEKLPEPIEWIATWLRFLRKRPTYIALPLGLIVFASLLWQSDLFPRLQNEAKDWLKNRDIELSWRDPDLFSGTWGPDLLRSQDSILWNQPKDWELKTLIAHTHPTPPPTRTREVRGPAPGFVILPDSHTSLYEFRFTFTIDVLSGQKSASWLVRARDNGNGARFNLRFPRTDTEPLQITAQTLSHGKPVKTYSGSPDHLNYQRQFAPETIVQIDVCAVQRDITVRIAVTPACRNIAPLHTDRPACTTRENFPDPRSVDFHFGEDLPSHGLVGLFAPESDVGLEVMSVALSGKCENPVSEAR
jgi:hypothetical protein